jgi:hypothetical protein
MRYKTAVSTKLEALDNRLGTINSLLSQPNLSRQEFELWYEGMKERIAEIQTLVNTEQEG